MGVLEGGLFGVIMGDWRGGIGERDWRGGLGDIPSQLLSPTELVGVDWPGEKRLSVLLDLEGGTLAMCLGYGALSGLFPEGC